MQKRVITPYPGSPDLSVYEEEDLDSAFSPRPEEELDHSCRYKNANIHYLHVYFPCAVMESLAMVLCILLQIVCVSRVKHKLFDAGTLVDII